MGDFLKVEILGIGGGRLAGFLDGGWVWIILVFGLIGSGGKPAFGFDCCGASLARGGDGLSVLVVSYVACNEDTWEGGGGAACWDEVAIFVGGQLASEWLGVWFVADGYENAGDCEFGELIGEGIFE